ncbi:MAG: 4Fe-4S dicluster domain-containing protein [Promethearchaeota archaeon]|jgi:NAD-dependent dihydropyrimidine dehydrogenase PreA subunit
MCKWCFQHGIGEKWYLNAKNYSDQLAKDLDLEEYLTEQWMNFETVFIRKITGLSSKGLGYKLQMPLIGRIVRWAAERMIHAKVRHPKAIRADGHIGQVIPLEDAQIIMSELAGEPIIENYCLCRYMQRGVKTKCCINFGVLSGVIEKLPRFLPKDRAVRISRDEAIDRLEEHNKKGFVSTVWYQPVPYICAICSCESPECGALRLRNDFDLMVMSKAEYIVHLNQDNCQGCKNCVAMCQWNAIRYIPSINRIIIDYNKCFGCGVCRHACKHDALSLMPRQEFPGFNGHF